MANGDAESGLILSEWPVPRPRQWRANVNKPQTEFDLEAIRRSVKRGTAYGSTKWLTQSAARLRLEHTLRTRGRPRKRNNDNNATKK